MSNYEQLKSNTNKFNLLFLPETSFWALGILRLLRETDCLTNSQLQERLSALPRTIYANPNQAQIVRSLATLLDAQYVIECDTGMPHDYATYRLTALGRGALDQAITQLSTIVGIDETTLMAERETVERLRTDLLSTVSHELRTPLTLIRTSIGLLLDSDPDEEMSARLLRNIKQSTDRMHNLVTDLLDLVRLRQNRTELQVRAVDTDELVTASIALLRPLIDEKEQSLIVELPNPSPFVLGDYRRLERVLLNLLSNANIFSPSGATITVIVNCVEENVHIRITDTGVGIPPDALQHLFEQFYTDRTSSTSHNIGVGLGLPIAKGIIEAHGGQITVESTVGKGSCFTISLPWYRAATEGDHENLSRG